MWCVRLHNGVKPVVYRSSTRLMAQDMRRSAAAQTAGAAQAGRPFPSRSVLLQRHHLLPRALLGDDQDLDRVALPASDTESPHCHTQLYCRMHSIPFLF